MAEGWEHHLPLVSLWGAYLLAFLLTESVGESTAPSISVYDSLPICFLKFNPPQIRLSKPKFILHLFLLELQVVWASKWTPRILGRSCFKIGKIHLSSSTNTSYPHFLASQVKSKNLCQLNRSLWPMIQSILAPKLVIPQLLSRLKFRAEVKP